MIWFSVTFVCFTLITMENNAASDGISSYGFPKTFYSYTGGKTDPGFYKDHGFNAPNFIVDLIFYGFIGFCAFYVKNKKSNMQPEDYYEVTITDDAITVEHPKRKTETAYWDDLNAIKLINTDEGPWLPDIWLALIGTKSGCTIPHGSKGFEDAYNIISKYEGFNLELFIESMSCTNNAEFLLWEKK